MKFATALKLTLLLATSSCVTIERRPSVDIANALIESNRLNVSESKELRKAEELDKQAIRSQWELASHEQKQAVKKWIHYFTVKNPALFERYLARGAKYKPIIETILKKQGIPTYFYYLAMIESGFALHARSHAKAVGMWQFMASTGKRYGLRINSYIDERKDPIRATIAAARYLNDLHNVFQSWFLAMSAYNAGESRIMNAIMKHGTRDYWQLVDKGALPKETSNYVPKFIAAALIANRLEQYELRPNFHAPLPPLHSVAVASPVKISSISRTLGIDLSVLKKFNPHILRGVTNPRSKTYRIWTPTISHQLTQKVKNLKPMKHLVKSRPRYHRIRRGENLKLIARKYGCSIGQLKSINKLRSSKIYAGTRLKIPQHRLLKHHSTAQGSGGVKTISYSVKRGDTLKSISSRFKIGYKELKRVNHLRSNRIIVGQRLLVPQRNVTLNRYRVRRGDNLYNVAQRFGMNISALRKINQIKHSRIYIGQVLQVYR